MSPAVLSALIAPNAPIAAPQAAEAVS